MSPGLHRRSVWYVAPLLMLLLTAALGIRNGPRELRVAATTGQQAASVIEMGYGLFGLLSAVALYQERLRPTMLLLVAWATLITVTGALAPVVWGGAPINIGLASGLGTGAVATVILLMVRRAFRSAS